MTIVLGLIFGAAIALVFVRLVRAYSPEEESRVYAVGLVVTALIYVVFAVAGEASYRWLGLELLGVFVYGAAAWAGLWGRHKLLAAGWAAHVVWDVALHLSGGGAEYTPPEYPWSCISFDLVIAWAVLALKQRTTADTRGAA